MKQIVLTDHEYELLTNILISHMDEGPEGEGWKSPELEALTEKVCSNEPGIYSMRKMSEPLEKELSEQAALEVVKDLTLRGYPDPAHSAVVAQVRQLCLSPMETKN